MIREVGLHKKTSHQHEFISSNIQEFCQLQSAQLTSQQPILFARIVYHDYFLKTHQEVIKYAINQAHFLPKTLAYLRSESYLIDFPPVGKICEIQLHKLPAIAYICPIGYRNQKPEYIQIITNEPISQCLQDYIKQSAMLLSNYAAIYLDYGRQKAEIKLLEHILHRVGHQLRSHLAMIGLYANNLCLGLKESPWQEQATIINESIQDIDTNLTEIINCGQGEKLRTSPQDLRNLVLESIQCLQPLLAQKQVTISIPDISTTLLIDRLQIKQVFDNLLSNAVYFSPQSGRITCSWQIFQDEILIKISDQGPGISPEDTQQIFTPFYSTRPGGTGLGLAIAKKIILDHYGNLWAQSVSELGAQFCIILPRPQNI
ncbi:sensor histidine kinase [Nodularia sphaerocarpa]|uniref:sensor histidine kinase n=1 Tax=Nodularia sphaerocarpa TaxID=137816 RepID=UPI001EFB241F|nr:HAMP domain-containing sensor histidine kinase [Nodularia sphaerocarpa]MDB9373360.1 HAMP domain-containing sensor histidine kinase [Nodularia sphaerocarpa CS-585]MDB9378109.1 HAMP domain-containing sensor histidine kinase [Nodularia sphaerocarpa CS-585A2]ULP71951.1 Sensor histidine kinase WalK [Nodularia sphaerocarpa UHCC 0038]